MRRRTTLAVVLSATTVFGVAGCAQTTKQTSSSPAPATSSTTSGKATVEKPSYPGMAPSRMPDGSPITEVHHNVVEKPTYPGMSQPRMPDGTPISNTTNFGAR